jgi:hypothetical protein
MVGYNQKRIGVLGNRNLSEKQELLSLPTDFVAYNG